jgi:predicted ATPase/DNA-binding CsgD family transcriptional regulator
MTSASALAEAGVSGRETEVLALLGEHLSHAEIATRLFISVRTVESHVASLRRKLNVGTHRELVRLAARYRAAETGPGPGASPRRPAPLTSFVGRDGERAALAVALGTSRLVSAVGPGGIGKTRLALAVAADVADRFGGSWYVDLVPVIDPGLLPAAVLAGLGADESSSRPAEDVLAAAVGERRALLVLDNCEHLVNAVAMLTERLLSACPNLSVLVTSRIRLVVPHETVYPVPGLSVPPPGGEGGDAAALFAERAAAAGAPLPAGPAGAAGDAGHRAAAICRALAGMPLAIELAAARLPSLGLDGLEAGLGDQLSLLSGGSRQQQRHRSLHDTLDWSYRLLDPREQAMLRRAAVFAGPFGLAAATAVAGYDPVEPTRVADALGRLAEHSLLVPAAGAGGTRYHALEPVRQFAAVRLGADDADDQRVRGQHLAWCLTEAAGLDRADPAGPAWQVAFDAAADEFRAALAWSAALPAETDAARQADAGRLAATLAGLLFARGRLREAQQRYEQAATLAADTADTADLLERAAATAKIRTAGDEALRLDRAAGAAYLRAGDPAAASVAFARCAEHVNRFAGMYASPPAAGTAGGLLADARARAGDDPCAAAAIGSAEAQDLGLAGAPATGLAGRALRLARQADDPLLISAAYDAVTASLMTEGDIPGAADTAAERVSTLPLLGRDPRVAFELKDALHTAIFTGVAAGQIARSLDHAEQHYGLPFLREERDLGGEDLIAPAALAGQWDRALTLSQQWRRGWEHAGRPVAAGRGMAPAAAAMLHGLRGDDTARTGWLAILAAVRGVAEQNAVYRSGYGEVFEAIVLLDRGEPRAALDLLTVATVGNRSWRTRLWHQWMAALRAEAAVLARTPDAGRLVAEAEAAADRNPVAIALTRRAGALFRGDADDVLGTAAAFGQAGYPYQQARTLALAAAPRLYSSHEPGRPRAHPPGRTARRLVVRRRSGHGPADGARPAPVPDLAAAGRPDGPGRGRPRGRLLHLAPGLGGLPRRRLRAGEVVRRRHGAEVRLPAHRFRRGRGAAAVHPPAPRRGPAPGGARAAGGELSG